MANKFQVVIAVEVERCMRMWGSAGRAAEVIAQCEPWAAVEHLIMFNVEGLDKAGADLMMAEGQRVLSSIPGVREVFSGEAMQDNARTRESLYQHDAGMTKIRRDLRILAQKQVNTQTSHA